MKEELEIISPEKLLHDQVTGKLAPELLNKDGLG
jgi:hypothetical protein